MKNFANVDLESIDSLNLVMLRHMQRAFISEIAKYSNELRAGDSKNEKAILVEMRSVQQSDVLKHFQRYIAMKQYEHTVTRATLVDSQVYPNLKELMFLAKTNAPDEWRARVYLQDDCHLIEDYNNIQGLDLQDESENTFTSALVAQRKQNDLIQQWQVQLRNHYLAAMRVNLHKAKEQVDILAKLHEGIKHEDNLPYVHAMQIVCLTALLEYLAENMRDNSQLNVLCSKVIYNLDVALTSLKQLPRDMFLYTRVHNSWMLFSSHPGHKKTDVPALVRNFPRYRMLQESTEDSE